MRSLHFGLPAAALAALAAPAPAFGATSGPASGVEADATDTVIYNVEKGDNLYTLAERYFTRTQNYIVIQRLNRVADPYRLQIGKRLIIPRRLLRQTPVRALVHTVRGTVRIGQPGRMLAPAIGMMVAEGDLIETGGKSFVSLRMPDGTAVALPSQTRVRVERLRRTLLAGNVDRSFLIEKGRARGAVQPDATPQSEFRFSTPVAVSAVRGTVLRMGYDPDTRRATTEVIEGKVQFSATAGGKHLVSAGFGAVSNQTDPLPLLAPPEIIDAGRVQSGEKLRFAIRPLAGALSYRVQLARDAGFLEVLDEEDITSEQVEFSSIPNGEFFVRVTGFDQNALEGLPATYGFKRRLNRITTTAEMKRAGRHHQYLFRWHTPDAHNAQYRFQLSADRNAETPLVDEPGLTQPSFIITDLPPGVYFWRVKTIEIEDGQVYEQWTTVEEIRVEAA